MQSSNNILFDNGNALFGNGLLHLFNSYQLRLRCRAITPGKAATKSQLP